jgi:hypothetical protein
VTNASPTAPIFFHVPSEDGRPGRSEPKTVSV